MENFVKLLEIRFAFLLAKKEISLLMPTMSKMTTFSSGRHGSLIYFMIIKQQKIDDFLKNDFLRNICDFLHKKWSQNLLSLTRWSCYMS